MRISTDNGGKFAENRTLTDVNRRYFGVDGRFSARFTAKKGPGNFTPKKKGQFMNFRRGIPEQKFNANRACFPKEKHQNSQKWAKFI